MSDKFEIVATKRSELGKASSRRFRRLQNYVPAIVYGGNKEPMTVNVNHKDIVYALNNKRFFSHLITLNIDNQKEKVILKGMQRHPAKSQILHMDFVRADEDKELSISISLQFIGEEVAPGVKQGGKAFHHLNEITIQCLPKHIPEIITVDLTNLNLNQSIYLSDLILPQGVTLPILAQDLEHDAPVVSIQIPRVQEVEESVVAAPVTPVGGTDAAKPEDGKAKESKTKESKAKEGKAK